MCRKHEGDKKLKSTFSSKILRKDLSEDGIIVLYWILRKREEGERGIHLALGVHDYKGGACRVVGCNNFSGRVCFGTHHIG